MARRDYASKPKRSPSAARPAATRHSPAPAVSKGRPIGLILSALLATALLAGLVIFLSGQMQTADNTISETVPPQPKPATKPVEPAKPAPSVRAPGESLPLDQVELQQDERFDFYSLLKKSEVETPEESAYTSTPRTAELDTPYILQAGSFRSISDAEAMRARLTLAGLPNVRAGRSEGSNGVWFRVTTGPFTTYNELKNATAKLEKLNIHPVKRKAN